MYCSEKEEIDYIKISTETNIIFHQENAKLDLSNRRTERTENMFVYCLCRTYIGTTYIHTYISTWRNNHIIYRFYTMLVVTPALRVYERIM